MLTAHNRSLLRSKYNAMACSINIGKQGISQNTLNEISTWLFHKEIVKIGLLRSFDSSIDSSVEEICAALECDCVQKVGRKAILYKFSEKEDIEHIL